MYVFVLPVNTNRMNKHDDAYLLFCATFAEIEFRSQGPCTVLDSTVIHWMKDVPFGFDANEYALAHFGSVAGMLEHLSENYLGSRLIIRPDVYGNHWVSYRPFVFRNAVC